MNNPLKIFTFFVLVVIMVLTALSGGLYARAAGPSAQNHQGSGRYLQITGVGTSIVG